ncbi:DUF6171 family protein [Enterococcus rotai]|uniref:DUF6171 family protein n=1 Tax=Enterococcus rotai TaxID=118060 RepID=UPI0032B54767
MSCLGCEIKETTVNIDVQQIIAEQLLVESHLAGTAMKEQRMKMCESCPFKVEHTCSKCGCFYEFRASLAEKKCPIGNW